MTFNPKIHHRRSIRLKGYDYSSPGFYVITLVTQNRKHFFGKITQGILHQNQAGLMVEKWYLKLESKFPNVKCHTHVIMPNHVHCILEILAPDESGVGVGGVGSGVGVGVGGHVGPPQRVDPPRREDPPQLGTIIQWFKTMSTNEYIRNVKANDWPRFDRRLWQRDYWEHIIRNDRAYHIFTNYIINNPKNWKEDRLQ